MREFAYVDAFSEPPEPSSSDAPPDLSAADKAVVGEMGAIILPPSET